MSGLAAAIADAGGAAAPAAATARLRALLLAALRHGRAELGRKRSGTRAPVEVAIGHHGGLLLAATPAAGALRADPQQAGEREWLLVAAVVGALVELAEPGAPADAAAIGVRAGQLDGFLVVALPAPRVDPATLDELVPLAFDHHAASDRPPARRGARDPRRGARRRRAARADRRRASAADRRGGRAARRPARRPALGRGARGAGLPAARSRRATRGHVAPHDDPDPARRAARRILQRLNGMGKWGGYHTDFAHLARGFAGNERRLADAVGEALIADGLLAEKPSVGQRHVFLNPRRAADIHRMIETGAVPPGLKLP